MISFCCCFYPWYREHERTMEVFDVLIKGLNTLDNAENLELSIVNAGVMDVWDIRNKNKRSFDNVTFEDMIRNNFKGKVKYSLDAGCIHYDKGGTPRFWAAKAIQNAVIQCSYDHVVITGIDCYFTGSFYKRYFKFVGPGQAWVILPTVADSEESIGLLQHGGIATSHYTARGIVGITKSDFFENGGYNTDYIKDRSDSNFHDRLSANNNISVLESYESDVFHVWHPGSHMAKTN